ncbi:hypothetical protein AAVH_30107 [Aphelenchoides avenae]|nr:hypothetical protein AAVH_30107 [Aphelenchus avenae]
MSVTAYYFVMPTEVQAFVIGTYMAITTACIMVILGLLYKTFRFTQRISQFIDAGVEANNSDEEYIKTPSTARTSGDEVFML